MNVYCESYEPMQGKYTGYCISHGENLTLAAHLSTDTYRPSCYYVYRPCAAAEQSLKELRKQAYEMHDKYYVYTSRDIRSGYDSVGALLLFEDGNNYWCGTIVDNEQALEVSHEINATGIQVACGVLAAARYALEHPHAGILFPEDLDFNDVLDLVTQYLGTVVYERVDYAPKSLCFEDLRVTHI